MRRQRDRLRVKERPLPVSLPLALPASELQSAETAGWRRGDSSAPGMPLDLFICLPWARSLYVTQTGLEPTVFWISFPSVPTLASPCHAGHVSCHLHHSLGSSLVSIMLGSMANVLN